MAQDFTMPKLGLTMTDGTIREWLVSDGTFVNAGDPVLIIETDKVETEVEARESGVLTPTGVVGETYECGAVIGLLLDEGETSDAAATAVPEGQGALELDAPPPAAAEATPPPAAPVAAAPPAAVAVAAGHDIAARGEHGRILASPRARAAARERGIDLAAIAGSGPEGRILFDDVPASAAAPAAVAGAATVDASGRIMASPRARATAREHNLDLSSVSGTGPGGRIVHDDVVAAASAPPAAAPAPAAPAPPAAPAAPSPPAPATSSPAVSSRPGGTLGPAATGGARLLADLLGVDLAHVPAAPGQRLTREDVAAWVRERLAGPAAAPAAAAELAPLLQEPTTLVPLRGMRGVIAERMHASLTEMAQLTLSVDADMTALNVERERRKADGSTAPGYTAWVVAAASRALVDHPYVNSQVTADGVAHLPDVNLGVAVALDDGLIVPVVHHADREAVADLHTKVADLAARARSGKLAFDELQGGTFSVTALGMYGVDMFTPVINPPNTAILGVGRLRTDTKWVDGAPTPVTVMTLSLTWDHRAFDGAPAAEFAQTVVRYLENPAELET